MNKTKAAQRHIEQEKNGITAPPQQSAEWTLLLPPARTKQSSMATNK